MMRLKPSSTTTYTNRQLKLTAINSKKKCKLIHVLPGLKKHIDNRGFNPILKFYDILFKA
jgi:hypothetical protein